MQINDILVSPHSFEGKKVEIKGEIKEVLASYAFRAYSRLFSRFKVSDGTGEILVLVSPVVDKTILPGDEVTISGIFSTQFYAPVIISMPSKGGSFKLEKPKEYIGLSRKIDYKVGPYYLNGILTLTDNDIETLNVILKTHLDPSMLVDYVKDLISKGKSLDAIIDLIKALTLSSIFYPRFNLESVEHTLDIISEFLKLDLDREIKAKLEAYSELLNPIFSEKELKTLFTVSTEEIMPEIRPVTLDVDVPKYKTMGKAWKKVSILINYLRGMKTPMPRITMVVSTDPELRFNFVKSIAKEAKVELYLIDLEVIKMGPKFLDMLQETCKTRKSIVYIDPVDLLIPSDKMLSSAPDNLRSLLGGVGAYLIYWMIKSTKLGIPVIVGAGKPENVNQKFMEMVDITIPIGAVKLTKKDLKEMFEGMAKPYNLTVNVDYDLILKRYPDLDKKTAEEIVRRALIKVIGEGRKKVENSDIYMEKHEERGKEYIG